jgi:hypothetical protein
MLYETVNNVMLIMITHRATVFGQLYIYIYIYIIDFLCDCIITRGGNLI